MSKNRFLTALFAAIALIAVAFSLVACGDVKSFTVTFDSDGGTSVVSQTVNDGDKAIEPSAPTKNNCEFAGWYLGETRYFFDKPVTTDLTLTAHWTPKSSEVTHTVTFDSNGGSSVASQTVEHGKLAVRPSDPTKDGYDFSNWSDSSHRLYDFTTPVTEDITLTAEWDPKQFNVTFDSDGGSEVDKALVTYGTPVKKPDNPTKTGCFFAGWYVGDTAYDFSAPVAKELTIKAHWISTAEFTSALAADYSNFTSTATYTDATASYTNIFKQTATLAYWQPGSTDESGAALYEDHLIVFSQSGEFLASYYLHDEQWLASNLSSYAEFVLALNLDDITVEDVEYDNGIYRVVPESVASVAYALYADSATPYVDISFEIANGRIAKIAANIVDSFSDNPDSVEYITHVQAFTNFGTTVIELPDNLPPVEVEITARNRQTEQGTPLNADELIKYLFSVKVQGKAYEITSDMVDFGDLNLSNPSLGEHTVTLSFKTWDNVTHTETAKIIVQEYQGNETFAEIFAKDYGNVTMKTTTTASTVTQATVKHSENIYCSEGYNGNTYYYVEADGSLTRYRLVTGVYQEDKNNWSALPRLDILFDLDVSLFEQSVDNSNVYIAKNKEEIIPFIEKAMSQTYAKNINKGQDYSISLTVELGRVTKILMSCSYDYFNKLNAYSVECTLSDFGITVIEIPAEVAALRNPSTAQQSALIQDKRYAI